MYRLFRVEYLLHSVDGVSAATFVKLDFIVFGSVEAAPLYVCPKINFNKLLNNSFNFICCAYIWLWICLLDPSKKK